MRDHHAGAAVVGLFTVETIEHESDEPIAVECADSELPPVTATQHETRQILGRVLRGDVVIAERIVERSGHRLEVDAGERANVDQCARTSGASSPTPRMTPSIESPPRSRPNAVCQMRESSGVVVRISGTHLSTMRKLSLTG